MRADVNVSILVFNADQEEVEQYRNIICFEWPKNASGPLNVEIVDYH